MKNKLFQLGTLILMVPFLSFSQEVDSRKIIEKGVELHDNKQYDEAIAEFKKVSRNDTNYVLAAVELANTYITLGKDSLGLILCNSLLDQPSQFRPTVLTVKANFLDNLKRSDEAMKVYEEGSKLYPLNYSFYYEAGVVKLRQNKYKEAQDWFIKSVKVNPYHGNTHFQLGYMALLQGKLIPAMLAWQYYLTIDNSSSRARSVISTMEKLAKNEYDYGDIVNVPEFEGQDDFSELETLVKSKVALGSKYKSQTKLDFNVLKQIQLILEKLEYNKDDKGFYMQFYAPFFIELYKNKYFEPYSYYILSGLENKEVDGWISKNSTKVSAFGKWLTDYVGKNFCTTEENLNGKLVKAQRFYSNNKIAAVGNLNEKNEYTGYWNFYYSNGIKKSEGGYNDHNERHGIWKFYSPNGLIRSKENYVNGKIEGLVEGYFSNGSPHYTRNYNNDLLEGKQISYYSTGALEGTYDYKNNLENGKEIKYYRNGKLEYELNVVNDKYEGNLVLHYMDGHVKQKSDFVDNKRNGKYVEYYDFPENAIKYEANYDKGVLTGTYKSYHENGAVAATGEYKNGEKTGLWKSFNDENVLLEEETFNNGKFSGSSKYYTDNGKLAEEYIYKNEMLQEYKAFDPKGNVVYQNKKDGKSSYDVNLFYPNGNKKREGKIKGGDMDGLWKSYNINGYLYSEENYTAGKRNGKTTYYHENGKIESETEYENGDAVGYFKEYYKNGNLKREGAFLSDQKAGEWKQYYADGKIQSVVFYKNGSQDQWQQFYSGNGKLEYEELIELDYVKKRLEYDSLGNFQESVLDKGTGVLEFKYPNGKTQWKINYKNSMMQGDLLSYYPNGKVLVTKTYVDDEPNGPVKFYYPSGQLKQESNFVNGNLHGNVIDYYEDGNIKSKFEYQYGAESGKTTFYYPNKQVQTEYSYKNDRLHGPTKYYSESGDLIVQKNFDNNTLISYQYTDKTGNLCAPIELKNETGELKAYYKSGAVSLQYNIKNGMNEGKKIIYFPNNKIAEETDYICGDKEGKRIYYYSSGKIKTEENWKANELYGPSISYYENGKVKSEKYYLNNKKFGAHKNYDETGKLVKTYFYYDDTLLNEN
jgi:antitoxin component YwqK of YwqJK toxin-antitoxin module/Tfp pilus assembly protein PilF